MPINWVLGSIYSVLLCLFIAFTRYKGGWVSMLRQRVIPRHATYRGALTPAFAAALMKKSSTEPYLVHVIHCYLMRLAEFNLDWRESEGHTPD
jgi:hypothetical protein